VGREMARSGAKWLTVGVWGDRMGHHWGTGPTVEAAEGLVTRVFVGAYDRQLDDKGRVALPSRFRAELSDRCYLAKGTGQCVTVVPAPVFEAEADAMRTRVVAGEVPLNHLRALAGSAQMVTIDKQGRITLDEPLRRFAELRTEAPVTVAGAFDRLEIWIPDRYVRLEEEASAEMAGGTA
jgi:MraZ protein